MTYTHIAWWLPLHHVRRTHTHVQFIHMLSQNDQAADTALTRSTLLINSSTHWLLITWWVVMNDVWYTSAAQSILRRALESTYDWCAHIEARHITSQRRIACFYKRTICWRTLVISCYHLKKFYCCLRAFYLKRVVNFVHSHTCGRRRDDSRRIQWPKRALHIT